MARKNATDYGQKITAFLGSRWCFIGILAVLALEALWIALSGRYPMAFDENFHLGIIRLYAHHASPFWSAQPAGADVFGAVFRDPSYLYHYMMSFPYRLVSLFTHDQTIQVLCLRFINIALFASALPLFRQVLLKTGASRVIVHACLAIFVLIPIVPLLAAQINYDNLLLPMIALALLLAVNFTEELRLYKRINIKLLLQLSIISLLACLVKYAFLPILAVIAVYLLIRLYQTYSGTGKFWLNLSFGWTLMKRSTRWLLVLALLLSCGLFAQRYGVNLARYHKPVPSCEQVLSTKQCSAYSPWNRDYKYAQLKPADATTSPLVFTADWFYGMWFRTFFAVDGPASIYATRGPFVLPAVGSIILASVALVATAVTWKRLMKRYQGAVIWFFVSVSSVYAAALWLDGYQSFLQTGQPVALNGRYLLPVYPLLLIVLALGINTYLKSREQLKVALATVALICMFWGGGALTYILRSSDSWYWPNQTVHDANHAVQNTLGPLTPGYRDPYAFMGHHGT